MSGPPGEHLGDLISALVDEELAESESEAAWRHLAACGPCSAELEEVKEARALVRGLPFLDLPPGFFDDLVRPPDRSVVPLPGRGVPWSPRRVGVAAAAAAAAAVVLLGLAPPRDVPVSPSVNSLVEAHATGASFGSDPLSRFAPIGVPVTFRR